MNEPVILNQFDIKVPDRRIYFRIGYKTLRQKDIPENIKELVCEMREVLKKKLDPRAVYRVMDYAQTNRHPIFKHAEKVALCICTVGPKIEEQSRRWMEENQLLKGYIMDSFGSEAAEALAGQCDRIIVEQARKKDLWPSKRFSPGYGKWDITEQEYLFQVLPAEKIGVRLSESYMMIPRKSVSFRINWYRDRAFTTRSLKAMP